MAVDVLITHGYVDVAYQSDPWGNRYRWDIGTNQFFSRGPNMDCDGNDDISITSTATNLGLSTGCPLDQLYIGTTN